MFKKLAQKAHLDFLNEEKLYKMMLGGLVFLPYLISTSSNSKNCILLIQNQCFSAFCIYLLF